MIGGCLGLMISLIITLACPSVSLWWLLWGSAIGAACDWLARTPFGEFLCDLLSLFAEMFSLLGD